MKQTYIKVDRVYVLIEGETDISDLETWDLIWTVTLTWGYKESKGEGSHKNGGKTSIIS